MLALSLLGACSIVDITSEEEAGAVGAGNSSVAQLEFKISSNSLEPLAKQRAFIDSKGKVFNINTAEASLGPIVLSDGSTENTKVFEGPYQIDLISGSSVPSMDSLLLDVGLYNSVYFNFNQEESEPSFVSVGTFDYLAKSDRKFTFSIDLSKEFNVTNPEVSALLLDQESSFEIILGVNAWFESVDIISCIENKIIALEEDGSLVLNENIFQCGGSLEALENSVEKGISLKHQRTDVVQEKSEISYGVLVDERDGKAYRTVEVGGQNWMAENLNFGELQVARTDYLGDKQTYGKKYCLDDDLANCAELGGLYEWHTSMNIDVKCDLEECLEEVNVENHQGICPEGWHVPKKADWNLLVETVGGAGKIEHLMAENNWGDNTSGMNFEPSGQFDYQSYTEPRVSYGRFRTADEKDTILVMDGTPDEVDTRSAYVINIIPSSLYELDSILYPGRTDLRYVRREKHLGIPVRCLENRGVTQMSGDDHISYHLLWDRYSSSPILKSSDVSSSSSFVMSSSEQIIE
ncbi:hypothetical protein OAU52_01275 [bacterium]|nr:hypothetical protein [bacterium]